LAPAYEPFNNLLDAIEVQGGDAASIEFIIYGEDAE